MAGVRVKRQYADDGRPGKSFQRVGRGQTARSPSFLSHGLRGGGASVPGSANIAADLPRVLLFIGAHGMTPTHPRHTTICPSYAQSLARRRAD